MTTAALSIGAVSKSFGETPVLRSIDLDVDHGAFVSLLGPSGCGKTTLLRIIAGSEAQNAGTVSIGGRPVDHLAPKERGLAMVFQSYALYPHMTVAENISMPLLMERMTPRQRLPLIGRFWPGHGSVATEIKARVRDVAELTEIASLLHRRPAELSGGQRQRVALARAIVREPTLFLMDEPLSNLDAKLRVTMRSELVALNKRLDATVLYVTHDQTEAMAMSDRIALMMDGAILQYGTPSDIYHAPAHLDVATFIGQPAINLFEGRAGDGGAVIVPDAASSGLAVAPGPAPVTVAVRPEAFCLRRTAISAGTTLSFSVRLERAELLGAEVLMWCRTEAAGRRLVVQIRAADFEELRVNGQLDGVLTVDATRSGVHLFGSDGVALAPLETAPDANAPRVAISP